MSCLLNGLIKSQGTLWIFNIFLGVPSTTSSATGGSLSEEDEALSTSFEADFRTGDGDGEAPMVVDEVDEPKKPSAPSGTSSRQSLMETKKTIPAIGWNRLSHSREVELGEYVS